MKIALGRRAIKLAIASVAAGGVLGGLDGALPVGAVHPPVLTAGYSCSADHVSFLANDNGSQEFAALGSGTLSITGPAGAVTHDPADGHAFTWTWAQTNDYNALNIGKVKIQDPDSLLLPAGAYTVSQRFKDGSAATATFQVPNPSPAAGCPSPPATPAPAPTPPQSGGGPPAPPAGAGSSGTRGSTGGSSTISAPPAPVDSPATSAGDPDDQPGLPDTGRGPA